MCVCVLAEEVFQFQVKELEATKNQEEEEPCKQPLLISHVAESKGDEIVHRRGLMKKPLPRGRVLDQAISTSGSPPKKLKKHENVEHLEHE